MDTTPIQGVSEQPVLTYISDIGGTKILGGVVDENGELIERSEHRFASNAAQGPAATARTIRVQAMTHLNKWGIPLERVKRACVLPPAPVKGDKIFAVSNLGNPQWTQVDFAAVLRSVWPELESVVVQNDAKAAGMGIGLWVESEMPEYRGTKIAIVTMGTGWGGCLVVIADENEPTRLDVGQGRGGEFGMMRISLSAANHWGVADAPAVTLKSEHFGSRTGHMVQLKQIFEVEGRFPTHQLRQCTHTDGELDFDKMSKELRGLAIAGDSLCKSLFVDLQAEAMALLFAHLVLANDPSLFVIGGDAMFDGGVPESMRLEFLDLVRDNLSRALPPEYEEIPIVFYPHGDKAALSGAAELAKRAH